MSRQEVCVLPDGRRVGYSLKRRGRDPFYLAVFRGPDGRPRERSTKEPNQKRARDATIALIIDEYTPRTTIRSVTWDEADAVMVQHMKGQNLRPRTIDDYRMVIRKLRAAFPEARGPADITESMAKQYKIARIGEGLSAHTVGGNLNKFSVIWRKWLIEECGLVAENPWEKIEHPKTDRLRPRIITSDEQALFLEWLERRWEGWRLPALFLRVKASIGCRLLELCSARTNQLREGRLVFESESCKGRKERQSRLPPDLYDELRSIAGKTYLWERFPQDLRSIYRRRGQARAAQAVGDFSPARLKRWIQKEKDDFLAAHKDDHRVRRFKLHNFRGTAMSRAKQAGATYDQASVAFGCHPETMRKHYLLLDEMAISDAVFELIQEGDRPGEGNGADPPVAEGGDGPSGAVRPPSADRGEACPPWIDSSMGSGGGEEVGRNQGDCPPVPPLDSP